MNNSELYSGLSTRQYVTRIATKCYILTWLGEQDMPLGLRIAPDPKKRVPGLVVLSADSVLGAFVCKLTSRSGDGQTQHFLAFADLGELFQGEPWV